MDTPPVNIHTHARTGEGIEMVSVMAGRGMSDTAGAGGQYVRRSYPAPPFSIGVHPWQAGGAGIAPPGEPAGSDGKGSVIPERGGGCLDGALREVDTAPASAVGEIGLDLSPRYSGVAARQEMLFAAQLRVAGERLLPVVLHCVRAFEPTMEILSGFRLPAVIFHGFVGSPEQAARAVKSGYRLSFGERSLVSPGTVEALGKVPLERLFLETDESPLSIGHMYAHAAKILRIPVAGLARCLYSNYLTVFAK